MKTRCIADQSSCFACLQSLTNQIVLHMLYRWPIKLCCACSIADQRDGSDAASFADQSDCFLRCQLLTNRSTFRAFYRRPMIICAGSFNTHESNATALLNQSDSVRAGEDRPRYCRSAGCSTAWNAGIWSADTSCLPMKSASTRTQQTNHEPNCQHKLKFNFLLNT